MKFSPDEIAQILAEQQGLDVGFFWHKIREGYAKGLLKFYLPDGSPHDYKELPEDHPMPWEYYLGISCEYSTAEDIDAWLEAWGAKYRFKGGVGQPKEKKTAHQRRLILEAISGLNCDPKKLPKTEGQSGVKKRVREQLCGRYPFDAETAFDTTWRELRRLGEIADV